MKCVKLLLVFIVIFTGCNSKPDNVKRDMPIIDHYRLGEQAYKVQDMKKAKLHYEAILAKQPGNIDAHFRLGNISTQTKNYSNAMEHYKEVLFRKPNHEKAHYNLAITHLVQAENHFNYYSAVSASESHDKRIVKLLNAINQYSKGGNEIENPLDELADLLTVN
jgi:tetratricopeptide (TPR) repeat protein